MPLTSDPQQAAVMTADGVAFAMFDGATQQPCFVTREALQDLRTKHHADALETPEERVFAACRPEIEALASRKHEAGSLSDDGVVEVRAQDIP